MSGDASGDSGRRRAVRVALRIAVTLALLALLSRVVDPREVLSRLTTLDPSWVGVALALGVVQVVLSAWRWRFTARAAGLELPLGGAVGEYWLATLLNQILPGGVVGDVSRAWRHARVSGAESGGLERRAVHAVLLERGSGQVVMTGVAVGSGIAILAGGGPLVLLGTTSAVVTGIVLLGRSIVRRGREKGAGEGDFVHSLDRALVRTPILVVQLLTSLAVIASYIAMFVAGALALGVSTPVATLIPLVAPILVTMLLPVSIAGWGVRETAAAALWTGVGLTAADGVAISVTYGLLVLVSSLPGAVVPLLQGFRTTSKTRSVPTR